MRRRRPWLSIGVVVLLATTSVLEMHASASARPSAVSASAPTIATDDMVSDSNRTGNFEIYTMSLTGSNSRAITNDPSFDSWWPRISPDRRTVLFYRTPKGTHDLDYTKTSLWSVNADGSNLVELRPAGTDGWTFQGHAEWSPDGQHVVMFGGSRTSPQIYITDAQGKNPRAVTDRPGSNFDPSYSPDGSTIVFVGCPQSICLSIDQESYRVSVNGGQATRLTNDHLRDNDPYYSPNGKQLAWLTQITPGLPGTWDIRLGDENAGSPHRLMNDNGVTSRPQWSADGKTLYFHRLTSSAKRFDIYSASLDGSNLTNRTQGQAGASEYPGL